MRKQIRLLYEKFGPPVLSNFQLDNLGEDIPAKAGVFGLVDQDGRIVLIQRKPHPDHPGWERYWWLPGGGREPDEAIEQVVIREFKEETGLEIRLSRLLVAGIHRNRRWFYFILRGHVVAGELSPHLDPDGTTAEVRYFLPSEIPLHDLWSDWDKIVLVKEGLLDYPVDDLLVKHGLQNYSNTILPSRPL